jgi:DNA-binding transcriptional LysR family regulator
VSAPGLQVELVASNNESDLKRREADIALRGFRPTQPDLISKKLVEVAGRLYAAESYLDHLGHPASPAEFSNADFISFDHTDRLISMLDGLGFKLTPRNFSVTTESRVVQWELVKQGVGIGIMPEQIGDAEPGVERALPSLEPLMGEIWIVAHRELKTNRRARMIREIWCRITRILIVFRALWSQHLEPGIS